MDPLILSWHYINIRKSSNVVDSVALEVISDIVPDSTFSLLVHNEFRQTNNLKPNCLSNHPLLMLAKSINPCKSLSFFLNFFFNPICKESVILNDIFRITDLSTNPPC